MTSFKEVLESLWPGETQPVRPSSMAGIGAAPGFRPARSPAEARAEETTRVAREMTETDAEKRREATARLKAARLEQEAVKEAEARAQAELAPKKAKGRKKG